jgi:large subunit ribosomal protein L24e
MQNTVEAVKRISEIRQKREAHFILNRLAKSKEVQLRADLWEVDTNLKVVQAPAVQDEALKAKVKEKLGKFKAKKLSTIRNKRIERVRVEHVEEEEEEDEAQMSQDTAMLIENA